jgi:hypothetical protein
MPRGLIARYGVMVFDPDGDMEDSGIVLGPTVSRLDAIANADRIDKAAEKAGKFIQTLVIPIVPTNTGAQKTLDYVFDN